MRLVVMQLGRTGAGPQLALAGSQALADLGHDVRLVSSRTSLLAADVRDSGLSGVELDTPVRLGDLVRVSGHIRRARRALTDLLRDFAPDAVFAPMESPMHPLVLTPKLRCVAPPATPGRRPPRDTSIPYLTSVHDVRRHAGDESHLLGFLARRDLRSADGVMTFSETSRRQFLAQYPGFSAARVFATVLPAFEPDAPARSLRRRLPTAPRILMFGRQREYKGLDVLLAAWPAIRREHPSATLTIRGPGPTVDLPANAAGIDYRPGYVPEENLPHLFAEADLLVLPYLEASQSGVIGHAMTAGLPVVATPVGALPEQIHGTAIGRTSIDTSPTAFAEAVVSSLSDPAAYRAASAAAIRAATSTHSWRRMGADIAAACASLCAPIPRPVSATRRLPLRVAVPGDRRGEQSG